MADHIELRQLISAYVDGEISPAEQKLAERHIQECPDCRKYFHELQKISLSLKQWIDEDPSPDLQQKIQIDLLKKRSEEGLRMENTKKLFRISVTGGVLATVITMVFVSHVYLKRGFQGSWRTAANDIEARYHPIKPMELASAKQKDLKKQITSETSECAGFVISYRY